MSRFGRSLSGLSIGLLGPLSVTVGGDEVAISGARRRDVLIRLALNEGRPLESTRLLGSVWEGEAPAGAVNSLQAHVSYLRRQLGAGRLVTEGRAYRFDLEGRDGRLDRSSSRRWRRRGWRWRIRVRARRWGWCGRRCPRWRGPVLIDVVDHSWGQAEIARLTELHGVAHELLLDALLATGQYGEVAVAGEQAVTEHPLREELWRSLMLGLARAGRTAEAGTGVPPLSQLVGRGARAGAERRAVRVGRGDHLRSRALRVASAGRGLPVGCRGLPSTMVGRDDELRRLGEAVAEPGLITLVGAGGVGKTRVALEVAHAAAAAVSRRGVVRRSGVGERAVGCGRRRVSDARPAGASGCGPRGVAACRGWAAGVDRGGQL